MSRIVPTTITVPVRTQLTRIFLILVYGGVGILIATLVFGSLYSLATLDTNPLGGSIAKFALPLMLVALVLGYLMWKRGLSIGGPKLEGAIVHLLAFACLEYAIYSLNPDSGMFHGPGLLHIPTYLVFILVLFLVENLSVKKWPARLAMILAFTFLGWAHLPVDWKNKAYALVNGAGSSAPIFRCDGSISGPIQATTQPQLVVPDNRRCKATISVIAGTIRVEGPGGYVIQDPSGIVENHILAAGWRAQSIIALSSAQYTKQLTPD